MQVVAPQGKGRRCGDAANIARRLSVSEKREYLRKLRKRQCENIARKIPDFGKTGAQPVI